MRERGIQGGGDRKPSPEQTGELNRRLLRLFLAGFVAAGCLFLIFSLLRPHQTGTVVQVGRISGYTATTGRGKHRVKHRKYAADVKVRVKDSSRTETVYYRTTSLSAIPDPGDEIEFSSYLFTGNGPYPQKWAVRTGIFLLCLSVPAYAALAVSERRRRRGKREDEPEERARGSG